MSHFSGKRPRTFTVTDGYGRTTEEWKRRRDADPHELWFQMRLPHSNLLSIRPQTAHIHTHTVVSSDLTRVRQNPPPLSLKTSHLSPMRCMSERCHCTQTTHTCRCSGFTGRAAAIALLRCFLDCTSTYNTLVFEHRGL